jgi:hypothetical protein
MVYPGTEAFGWAKEGGYLASEDYRQWLTAKGLHRTVLERPTLSAEDLVAWCDRARRSFYLRPRYVVRKAVQALCQPAEAGRILRAARTFSKHLWAGALRRAG